jgi:hypothetical protein
MSNPKYDNDGYGSLLQLSCWRKAKHLLLRFQVKQILPRSYPELSKDLKLRSETIQRRTLGCDLMIVRASGFVLQFGSPLQVHGPVV